MTLELDKSIKRRMVIDADTIMYRNAILCQTNYDVISKETGRIIDYVQAKKDFYENLPDTADPSMYDLVKNPRPYKSESGASPVAVGCHGIKKEIERISTRFDWIGSYEVCVHEGGNFREDVATIKEYKGNRQDKPLFLTDVKAYTKKKFKQDYVGVTGEETDDYVAREGWKAFERCDYNILDSDTVIAHIDKDIDQVPGIHYNYNKDELYVVTILEAAKLFWGQCLTGDSSDNIPGIPKISAEFKKQWNIKTSRGYGDKAVATLFEGCELPSQLAERVVLAYKDGYGKKWLDILQEVSTLLYLRRQEDEIFSVKDSLDRLGVNYEK